MTRDQFASGVRYLRLAFDLDDVRPEVIAVWHGYDGVAQIDMSEWQRITRRMVRNEDAFPKNMVRSVLEYRSTKGNRAKIERPPEMTENDEAENREQLRRIMAGIGAVA